MLPGATQKESVLIPRIMRQLWVFLAYVAAARLAIHLALPPGYASPIWLAAGIAMAATIVWGPSLTIAVFFGSIVTNIRPDELLAHPLDQTLLQLCLALGSSLQAWVGSLLYPHLEKRLPHSASPRRVVLETFLIGPVACLTAATLAVGALAAFHIIEISAFFTNWFSWWLGDSFGAGMLAPLLIRLHARLRTRSSRSDAIRSFATPLLISMLVIVGLAIHLHNSDRRNRTILEHTVGDFHSHVQREVNHAITHMQILKEMSRTVDPLTVIERNQTHTDWMQTVWVPRVNGEDRSGFEKAFGNAQQDFTVLERTSTGHFTPAAARSVYWPLIFKTPHDFNLLPPGFDLGSLPAVQNLLQKTWEQDETLATPLVTLSNNKKALLILQKGQSSGTAFQQGLFVGIIKLDGLIKPLVEDLDYPLSYITITAAEPANRSLSSGLDALSPNSFSSPDSFSSWYSWNSSETPPGHVALYGNFQNTLTLAPQTFILQVDFPAEAFNSGRIADPLFISIICVLLSFTMNVLILSQQNPQTATAPNSKSQTDEWNLNFESIRDADRIKANLLANISHQIKSPLHGILGLLDMLRGTQLDPKQSSSVDTIIANCQSMRLILDDIYTYATMEIGQLSITVDEFLIEDFLRNLTSVYELAAEERQNHFKALIELPPTLRVRGDHRKLHRVLSHLLSDAIRRIQKGRISFKVSASSESQFTFAIETVRGTQDEVYDNDREFGNVKSYQTQEVFNLKTCDRIVQIMGGRLSLERPSSLASLIVFTLPMTVVASREPVETTAEAQHHQEVLVVDDNSINLTVAAGLLGKLGYSVETATDGREAVEKSRLKHYDVIFMDCQMPHMDGFEATRLIREASRPERGPLIIALTANAMDGGREQALQAGMDSVITKPISLDRLLKTVGYARKMQPRPSASVVSIMDFKTFSQGLGDDDELIQMAVIRYFEEIDGMMERLRGEVQRSEAVIVAKTAHTLKGMTSLFAAQPLVEANRNLEIAGKEGRIADFPALLKRIESLTELLKNELQPLIDEKNIPKKDVA